MNKLKNNENILIIFLILILLIILFINTRSILKKSKENRKENRKEEEIEGYSFENFTNPDNNEVVTIDLTQGWKSADDFRKNYCMPGSIIDKAFIQGSDTVPMIYGFRKEIYDFSNNQLNQDFQNAFNFANIDMNSINPSNGCAVNKFKDIKSENMGAIVQLCDPKCKFTIKNKNFQ